MTASKPEDARSALAFHEPDGWARPLGYANAVSAAGRVVFVAGQVGWDPATSEFPSDRFPDQVRQSLDERRDRARRRGRSS